MFWIPDGIQYGVIGIDRLSATSTSGVPHFIRLDIIEDNYLFNLI